MAQDQLDVMRQLGYDWQPGPEITEPGVAAAGKRLIALKKLH
jgi:hypothetical protein